MVLGMSAFALGQQSQSPARTATGVSAPGAPTSTAIGAPIQAPLAAEVPNWVRYRFFFLHLASLDKLAADQEAKGKDGKAWRTHAQRAAGLSEEEGKIMKQIAFECNQAASDVTAQADALMATYRTQVAAAPTAVPPAEQRRQLAEQKIQIINAHIDRLRSMLGDTAFQKLDTYLKETFKAEVRTSPATSAAQGAATTKGATTK
jgi:hypothetical protein